MTIDWWTLFLQTVNFLVLVWLLQHFLYNPVRAVIEKRRVFAEQALLEAEATKKAAAAAKTEFEAKSAELEKRPARHPLKRLSRRRKPTPRLSSLRPGKRPTRSRPRAARWPRTPTLRP